MTVIVLAAGTHKRWPMLYPKQLADVGGESILHRTVRQCAYHAPVQEQPIVVARWYWAKDGLLEHVVGFLPLQYWCIAETLLSTVRFWSERTVVLLGDVVWTDSAISDILNDATPTIRFHGNFHEMFGFTFTSDVADRLAVVAADVMVSAKVADDPNVGKVWNLYRAWCGFPRDQHRIESNCFHKVEDWTNDIDTWEDYQNMIKEHFK